MNASDREIGNFGLAIAFVAMLCLAAIVIAGTDRMMAVLVVTFLTVVLLWLSAAVRLRAGTAANREDAAQMAIGIGGFGSFGALVIAATGTGHWDAIGLIAFLGCTILAVAGATLGWHTSLRNRGESA